MKVPVASTPDFGQSPLQRLIQQRRSVRRFLDRPVERDKILTCLEAARLSPSAENVQPWRFLVIDDPVLRDKFSRKVFSGLYSYTKFASKAPVLILILGRLDVLANRVGKQIQNISYFLIDIGIAGEHIVLQAEELGLGTCWIGWFNTRNARRFFDIPKKYKVVSMMAMGYYEPKPRKEKKRRTLEEIAWFNGVEKPLG